MSEPEVAQRRRGGRDARRELRAAPIPDAERAVKPGMEGGDYKPLSQAQVERIHQAALDVLEQVVFSDAIPSCIELFTKAGATLTDEGRLLVPRALVEDTLAKAARHFVLPGQDPKHDLEPWGKKVYFGTAGAAVHIVALETRSYRESELADLYDAAHDVLVVEAPVETLSETVEQHTIDFEDTEAGADLRISWDQTRVRLSLTAAQK